MMQVRGPDGKVYGFPDGTSQDEMAKAMRTVYGGPEQQSASPEPAKEKAYNSGWMSSLTRGLEGLGDGVTLGLGPHIRAGARSLINQQSPQEAFQVERDRQKERREDYTGSTLINEMAGGALTGGGLANAGVTASRLLPSQASRLQRAAAVGTDAAAMGAVNAGAEGENPGIGAAIGFGLGAGTSAVVDKAGDALGRYLRRSQVMRDAPDTDAIRAAQKAAYKAYEGEDVAISANAAKRLVGDVSDTLQNMSLSRRQNPRVYGYLDDIAEHTQRADGVSMQTLENIRSHIAADLRGPVQGSERAALGQLRQSIDDFFEGVSQAEVVAGGNKTKAYNALRTARAETRRLKKAELLDEVFNKADGGYASGDANGLRLGLRSILRDAKKRALFTEEERQAIKAAADGNTVEMIMRQLGKLGPVLNGGGSNSLGAMLGMGGGASIGSVLGPGGAALGAVALPTMGAGARAAADAATRKNARYVQALVNQTGQLPTPGATQRLLQDQKLRAITADALSGAMVGPQ